LATMILNTFW